MSGLGVALKSVDGLTAYAVQLSRIVCRVGVNVSQDTSSDTNNVIEATVLLF